MTTALDGIVDVFLATEGDTTAAKRTIADSLEMNQYVLHWLDGKVEVIEGNGIKDAFNRAGIGAGALKALDYHSMVTV